MIENAMRGGLHAFPGLQEGQEGQISLTHKATKMKNGAKCSSESFIFFVALCVRLI